jgi:CheY-like chemotaxis protein
MMGDAVLEQLGADPRTREIPVVILSADATSMQFERMRTLGVQDYLTKPINVAAFLAMIDGARRRQVDALAG